MPFNKIVSQLNKIQLNRTGPPQEPERQKTKRVEFTYNDVLTKV